jgi:SAM-dependent methyltransferase
MPNPQHSEHVDQAKQEAFVGKILGDIGAAMATTLASIGDRLGLFKHLAAHGASTSGELAARAGVNERYVREWLGGMTAAGYLEFDPESNRFTLPAEYVAVLAQEGGPFFFGGFLQNITAMSNVTGGVIDSFRQGGGVPQSAYPEEFWDGLERLSAGWFENLLLQQWIPAMPDVQSKLERGARFADVGCGRGRALIKLAQALPRSTYIGFDIFEPTIERATRNAVDASVNDRVRFKALDVSKGLPEKFDVIATFDVVHDAVDPLGLLKAIRAGLEDDGIYICLDVNCSDKLEQNVGPLGAIFHGASVMYCMTTSLANGGAGLGTLGFHEQKVNEMCGEAGFSTVRRVPLENPFNNLYEVRP